GATVMVPLDGTPEALGALPVGRTLAEVMRATLHVVHVAPRSVPPREVFVRMGLTHADLHGTVLDTPVGAPVEHILRLATEWRSPLIVRSTRPGAAGAPGGLGPVAMAVRRAAPCPVVLVPPGRGLHPFAARRVLLPQDGTPTMASALAPAALLASSALAE